jgi:hypothetical protein
MRDEVEISMSLPLDDDGFLRRECPTCEREFKWFASDEGESEPPPQGGYYCPYCGVQASADAWHTKAQVKQAEATVTREVVSPELKKLERSFREVGRASGGLIETRMDVETPEEPDPLIEMDDMIRVDFSCHPKEPVKVLDNWTQPVHCLICGRSTEPSM